MPMQLHYGDADLEVREWWCPGAITTVGPEEVLSKHELVLARVGGHVRRFGRSRVVVDAAHVVHTSAGRPFRAAHAIALPQRATSIQLSDALLDALPPMCDRIPMTPAIALAHLRLRRAAQCKGPGSQLALQESALDIVRAAVSASTEPRRERWPVSRAGRAAVEMTLQVLAFRFAEGLSLNALAAQVGLSSWYLSRVFRRVTGVSIWQHVTALRLHAALDRMVDDNLNLSDLAFSLGFSSHSHFSAAFRRTHGFAPSRTRF